MVKRENGEIKDRLVSAAIRCFARKGYSATTLDEIAAETGVTKGAIYWHFKDKPELFRRVMQERTCRLVETIEHAVEGHNSAPCHVRAFLFACFAFYQENPDFAILLGRLRSSPGVEVGADVVAELQSFYRMAREVAGEWAQQGVDEGTFAPVSPPEAAAWIVAVVDGLVLQWALDPQAFDLVEAGRFVTDRTLRGLQA